MEKKNNGTLVGILIGLVIALIVVGGLIATGTLSFKSTETNTNIIENTNSNEQTIEANNFYDVNDLNIKVKEGYELLADIKNNSNTVESITIGTDYVVELDLSGKVAIKNYKASNSQLSNNLNIDKVIEIIKFDIPAADEEQLVYLLTEDGTVYNYKIGESNNQNFNVTKIDEVSNVKKLFISHYYKKNAGGGWGLFAIIENNECILLNSEAV